MSLITHNPAILAQPLHRWRGRRFVIAWPCVRASRAAAGLERARFMLAANLIDECCLLIEAWMECDARPERVILGPRRVPCGIAQIGALLHIDTCSASDLLALTITSNDDATLVYARTDLLSRAGLSPGAFDAPTLCCSGQAASGNARSRSIRT
jgi:hypothetical protein